MRLSIPTILISFSLLLLFSGCSKEPEIPKKFKINPTLPIVKINGHISDMNAIAFEWKPLNDPRVSGVYVYRTSGNKNDDKLHRIYAVNNPLATHYVDTTVQPGTAYKYRFSSFNKEGEESRAGKTIDAATLKLLESVSFFNSAESLPRSAKLIWRPHTNTKVDHYLLQRKIHNSDKEFKTIAKIKGRLNAEYIDTGLKDNKIYSYQLKAVTYDGIVSKPSNIVKVSTKPLPKAVQELAATSSKPKKIILTWKANPQNDIAYYKIYRSNRSGGGFKYYVKLHDTSYTDMVEEDGKTYYYKISAVDKDELESPLCDAVKGSTLGRPAAPVITHAVIKDNSARLHWSSSDKRTVGYIVLKTTKLGWLDKKTAEINVKKELQFTDVNVVPGRQYIYQVVGVDKDGIRSLPSNEHELMLEANRD